MTLFIKCRQDNAVIGDYIHIFPQVMAAQSEGRLVEMFGAGTAAVVSICPHDLSNISFISIFIRILFCHFKNYALLMRPKVLLM